MGKPLEKQRRLMEVNLIRLYFEIPFHLSLLSIYTHRMIRNFIEPRLLTLHNSNQRQTNLPSIYIDMIPTTFMYLPMDWFLNLSRARSSTARTSLLFRLRCLHRIERSFASNERVCQGYLLLV